MSCSFSQSARLIESRCMVIILEMYSSSLTIPQYVTQIPSVTVSLHHWCYTLAYRWVSARLQLQWWKPITEYPTLLQVCMRSLSRMSDGCFEELTAIFSTQYCGPPKTTFGLEKRNETLQNLLVPFIVHGPWKARPVGEHTERTYMKLVRMWNRLGILYVTTWYDVGVYYDKNITDVKPGFLGVESRTE